MTREHDIEDIVRRLLDHHARINAGLSFDETPPATSVYSEAATALSSLAAENGRLRKALYWLVRSGVGASHEIR